MPPRARPSHPSPPCAVTLNPGRTGPILLVFGLLTAACGSRGGPPEDVTRETLASGLERTVWHRLDRPPLRLDTLAVWRIWEEGSDYVFDQVTDTAGAPDGFYLADAGSRQVVRMDREGRPLRVLGRPGSGPGEFEFPQNLFVRDGELWVSDYVLRRYTVFAPDGAFLRSERWAGPGHGASGEFAVTPAGAEVYAARRIDGSRTLMCASWDGSSVDTLATMRTLAVKTLEIELPGLGPTTLYDPPAFAPDLHWAWAEPARVWTVTTADYRIKERDLSGRVLRELVGPGPDLTVTDADRVAFIDRLARTYGVDPETFRRANPGVEERYAFADRRPAVTWIGLDPLGRLWVEAATAEADRPRFDLFDRDLDFLGSIAVTGRPAAFTAGGEVLFQAAPPDGAGGDLFFVARIESPGN